MDIHLTGNPVEDPPALFSPDELTAPLVHEWPDSNDDLIGQIDEDALIVEALEAQKNNDNKLPVSPYQYTEVICELFR